MQWPPFKGFINTAHLELPLTRGYFEGVPRSSSRASLTDLGRDPRVHNLLLRHLSPVVTCQSCRNDKCQTKNANMRFRLPSKIIVLTSVASLYPSSAHLAPSPPLNVITEMKKLSRCHYPTTDQQSFFCPLICTSVSSGSRDHLDMKL